MPRTPRSGDRSGYLVFGLRTVYVGNTMRAFIFRRGEPYALTHSQFLSIPKLSDAHP